MIGAEWFDALYRASDDPWSFRTRWYEARKRAVTLACLPRARYRRGFEPGCSIGELTAALAPRCERLLACDFMPAAVEQAARRLAGSPHVAIERRALPEGWPEGRFDLIVASEIGYFLGAADLDRLASRALEALEPDGTLLACHWRHPIEGCELSGDAVHALLGRHAQAAGLARLVRHEEDDFVLECWSPDARSVARAEGLA